MNWVLLTLTLVSLARHCLSAYPEYQQQTREYEGPPVVPVILPGGFIADTEEVAKAKNLHFNAYAHAASNVKDSQYNPAEEEQQYAHPKYTQAAPVLPFRQQVYTTQQPVYSQPVQRQQDYNVPQQRYTGPISRASYAEPKPAVAYQPTYLSQPQQRYQGPPVVPVILPNGYIAETADVEAAKEHHFQLVAKAQAAVARAQEREKSSKYGYVGASYSREEDDGSQYDDSEQRYNQVYQPVSSAPVYNKPQRQPYQGPPVIPVVLPSGHIADTAEVAAAKISHLQQLLDAAQKSQPQPRYHTSR